MAEEIEVKLEEDGKEFTFVIKKMDEFKAESWMIRAGLVLGRELTTLGDFTDTKSLIHALCKVSYEEARPLLDELLDCCYYKSNKFEKRMTDSGARGLIHSPMTLLKLRLESAKANFGFLLSGDLLNSLSETSTDLSAKK